MTEYVQLTRMAPASVVGMARHFIVAMSGASGDGELETGVVPAGSPPGTTPTWFITSGPIDVEFAHAMQDAQVMFDKCAALGLPVSLEACQALLGACVVDPRGPFDVMADMGLELAVPPESAVSAVPT